ncbi:MAG: hypothetical protein U9Q06_04470 [Nanoarchaeota archaeon]|nr:hypothetical protein [Nanoarchaeota archaeon]
MPPSGFSQEAINGLLEFIRAIYQKTLDKYRDEDLTEESILQDSIKYLNGLIKKSVSVALDGTVSPEGIKGLQKFVSINFRDLIAEIHEGKKQEGKAMQTELEQIGKYLEDFKI